MTTSTDRREALAVLLSENPEGFQQVIGVLDRAMAVWIDEVSRVLKALAPLARALHPILYPPVPYKRNTHRYR